MIRKVMYILWFIIVTGTLLAASFALWNQGSWERLVGVALALVAINAIVWRIATAYVASDEEK